MRTNSRMSLSHTLRATCGTLPSNENELLTRHLAMRTNSLLTRQLSNENELLTHTLASKVRYFHVTPLQRRLLSSHQPQAALKLGNRMGFISVFVLSVATVLLWQLLITLTWVVTISGNYSGGFIISNYTGKKCTAPCLVWVRSLFSLKKEME